MAKRKYTRIGEKPTKYECTKRKCRWQGTLEEQAQKKTRHGYKYVCPTCGNDEFYGLLDSVVKPEPADNG